MHRSETELRLVALLVAERLPEDEDDARRVCELALELKRWIDGGPTKDSGGGARVSVFGRK